MKKIAIAVGLGLVLWNMSKPLSVDDKQTRLIKWANQTDSNSLVPILGRMTNAEIHSTYDFIFNYFLKSKKVPEGNSLYNSISAISDKYNIFT